ncbi:MAG: tRNA adenosine(34) deaminase TadA [Planctomycetota bacterium]
MSEDETYMRTALREARRALDDDEVPVGAVVVHGGRVIGRAYNQRERLKDPTAHAEMIALTQASAALENWRLEGATLYVTLEPCLMCAGALVNARIGRVVYGAKDPRGGACGSLYNVGVDPRLNHRFEIAGGVLEAECAELLSDFFGKKR